MRWSSSWPKEVGGAVVNRGAWTSQEDELLTSYIMLHGEGKWSHVPTRAGLNRSGKSCRLRWLNYLRPDIKRGNINQDEEDLIIRLHKLLGNRWSLIAGRLPGRTDNEIKNYWNTTVGKKLRKQSAATTTTSFQQQQNTSIKSSGDSEDNARPLQQVIQTKAVRCKNVVIQRHPGRPNCPEETTPSSAVNSVGSSDHLGVDQVHVAPEFTNQFPRDDVNGYVNFLSGPDRNNEFQDELNGVHFFREFDLDDNSKMTMAMDARSGSDEFSLINRDCEKSEGFKNIAFMDLDLMTFMLD